MTHTTPDFVSNAHFLGPQSENAAWVRNPIDSFILNRLEAAGLKPSPPADRVALLRRAYFDEIGAIEYAIIFYTKCNDRIVG